MTPEPQEDLDLHGTGTGISTRMLLNGVSLLIVCLAVAVGAVHWWPHASPTQPPLSSARIGQTTVSGVQLYINQATPAPLPLAPGWQHVAVPGLDAVQQLVNVPGQPGSMYACGSKDGRTLLFSRGNDRTWLNPVVVGQAQRCGRISIDPTDVNDIVVEELSRCVTVCSSVGAARLFRSFDGGGTWTELHAPGDAGFNGYIVWDGATLFAMPFGGIEMLIPSAPTDHLLMVSRNHAPFAWVDDQIGFFGPQVSAAVPIGMLGDLFYLNIATPPPGVVHSILATRDQGITWTVATIALPDSTRPTLNELYAPDQELLVISNYDQIAFSRDGGSTWIIPPLSAGARLRSPTRFATADGIILTFLSGKDGTEQAEALFPGATTWRMIAIGHNLTPATEMLTDGKGHLTALLGQDSNANLIVFPLAANWR